MPVEDVNQRMLQSAQTMFPAVRHQGRIVPWQAPEVATSVRGMWQAYRVWRQGARLGKRGLCSLTQFRHRTKQAKKDWFRAQVQSMELPPPRGTCGPCFVWQGL